MAGGAAEPERRILRLSSAQQIYERLRDDIVTGVMAPRQPIREGEIADSLGVSRTPVREALQRLATLGLVDIYPQRGTVVAPIRLEKIAAAQFIREMVEVAVVRLAAEADGPDRAAAAERVDRLLAEQALAAGHQDARRFFELDEAFHRTIFAMAGRGAVSTELEDVKVHLNRCRYISVNWPLRMTRLLAEHRHIAAAIAARDAEGAAAAMSAHTRTILEAVEALRGADAPGEGVTG